MLKLLWIITFKNVKIDIASVGRSALPLFNIPETGLIVRREPQTTLNKAKGRMFKSVGWTWNPIWGCTHNCKYCWARAFAERWGKSFEPQFREHFFNDSMPDDGSWIFVGSMGDIFCWGVPDEWLLKLFNYILECDADNRFLLQTKNPNRFLDFDFATHYLTSIKNRVIVGTTLETTEETPWSKAQPTWIRAMSLHYMKEQGYDTFLSLEPLADFNYETMIQWIKNIQPEAVEIGLENYSNYTTPPPQEKTIMLLSWLDFMEIPYVLKENLHGLEDSTE